MPARETTSTAGAGDPANAPDAPPPEDEPDAPPLTFTAAPDTDAPPPDAPALSGMQSALRRVCRMLGAELTELNVIVIGDARMAEMHERYRGEAGTTDVLTFDLSDDPPPASPDPPLRPVEGEIYVCLDEARRRAAELGHPVRSELMLYAVHGLLHLIGYDDRDADRHRIMHQKEDELLSALGLGRVFHHKESQP